MKKLFIILVLLVLLVLCAPAIVGFEVENRYRGLLNHIEQAGYVIKDDEYNRGFFSSRASSVLAIPVNSPATDSTLLEFTLVSKIRHGPFSPDDGWFGKLTTFDTFLLTSDGEPLFPETLNAQIKTQIEFSGDGRTELKIPALPEKLELEDGVFFSFEGINGEVLFDTRINRLDVVIQSPGLKLDAKNQGVFEVGAIAVDSRSRRASSGLMLGKGSFSVASLVFKDDGKPLAVKIVGIDVTAHTRESGENIDMTASWVVNRIHVDDEAFGPAVIEVDLESLSALALAKFQDNIREMQKMQTPPEQQSMAVMGMIMSIMPAVLEQDPGFSISRFELQAPQGKIELSFKIKANSMSIADLSVPQQILDKLVSDASLRMPESLFRQLFSNNIKQQLMLAAARQKQEITFEELEQRSAQLVEQQLNSFINQKFIERDGEYLMTVASLKTGLLSINGKVFPLSALQ